MLFRMRARTILFFGNFFTAIVVNLVSYTFVSYLLTFIPGTYIGLAIAAGGLIATGLFLFLPRFVARYGAQRLALTATSLTMVMLFAAASAPHTIASMILVVLVVSFQPFVYYGLDLLLEATVEREAVTGRVRSMFLTGGDLGILVAPLLIGTLLAKTDTYSIIFFTAGAILMPFLVLFASRTLPKGVAPDTTHVRDTLRRLVHDRDLAAVTVGHLILYLFYIWVPFYVPVYLHGILGIPWSRLGWIFSVILLPYLLIEYPAGWIADKVLGDKEMMLVGFVLAGSALASVSLLTTTSSTAAIVITLLATRTGAAFIESMTEGHFFRRVSEQDLISVSVFRGVWPVANVIAPLVVGAILLFSGSYQLLFLATGGFIVFAGTVSTFLIRDFR